ncbi:DUF4194 domain-containing protein [Luteimicrobium subarcticum]|uniref:Uncharacterized protein DUF4194 n=1 Tax=Luteimicrobium subarcticum TaxID=620910 RepID=A0A2M8WQY9_9MICO|nr:DUF4194 domain-containing protein [Luteimicrobium subarcticum]PJI93337.1 uncharacterized protein DUF4194 [Luteimicrobium subarcticum]
MSTTVTDDAPREGVPVAAPADGFVAPRPVESDLPEVFPGDTGTLDAEVRDVLVRVLRQRYLSAEATPALWRTLVAHQGVVESRLHDLYVRLVIDHDRGLAYKRQVRDADVQVPVLLRDEPYSRTETLLLVHLRTLYQRERGAGETSARVDLEDLEQTALSYTDPAETNLAARQREIRSAVARLVREKVLEEDSQGRYRVLPVVEVLLSVERLTELLQWLREDGGTASDDGPGPDGTEGADDEEDLA